MIQRRLRAPPFAHAQSGNTNSESSTVFRVAHASRCATWSRARFSAVLEVRAVVGWMSPAESKHHISATSMSSRHRRWFRVAEVMCFRVRLLTRADVATPHDTDGMIRDCARAGAKIRHQPFATELRRHCTRCLTAYYLPVASELFPLVFPGRARLDGRRSQTSM